MQFRKGSRRWVFLTKKYAIKIPTFSFGRQWWVFFLYGILENLHERYWWCCESGVSDMYKTSPYFAKIHWADKFGLIIIAERLAEVIDSEKFENDLIKFMEKHDKVKHVFKDIKMNNFGYRNNELVQLDYGYFEGISPCYLGISSRINKK